MLFALAAVIVAAGHLAAFSRQPRVAILMSGALWALYVVYEHQIATGVLCDSDCNIRVDLVLVAPLLAFATLCAHKSYLGQPRQALLLGAVLGAIGLLVLYVVFAHAR